MEFGSPKASESSGGPRPNEVSQVSHANHAAAPVDQQPQNHSEVLQSNPEVDDHHDQDFDDTGLTPPLRDLHIPDPVMEPEFSPLPDRSQPDAILTPPPLAARVADEPVPMVVDTSDQSEATHTFVVSPPPGVVPAPASNPVTTGATGSGFTMEEVTNGAPIVFERLLSAKSEVSDLDPADKSGSEVLQLSFPNATSGPTGSSGSTNNPASLTRGKSAHQFLNKHKSASTEMLKSVLEKKESDIAQLEVRLAQLQKDQHAAALEVEATNRKLVAKELEWRRETQTMADSHQRTIDQLQRTIAKQGGRLEILQMEQAEEKARLQLQVDALVGFATIQAEHEAFFKVMSESGRTIRHLQQSVTALTFQLRVTKAIELRAQRRKLTEKLQELMNLKKHADEEHAKLVAVEAEKVTLDQQLRDQSKVFEVQLESRAKETEKAIAVHEEIEKEKDKELGQLRSKLAEMNLELQATVAEAQKWKAEADEKISFLCSESNHQKETIAKLTRDVVESQLALLQVTEIKNRLLVQSDEANLRSEIVSEHLIDVQLRLHSKHEDHESEILARTASERAFSTEREILTARVEALDAELQKEKAHAADAKLKFESLWSEHEAESLRRQEELDAMRKERLGMQGQLDSLSEQLKTTEGKRLEKENQFNRAREELSHANLRIAELLGSIDASYNQSKKDADAIAALERDRLDLQKQLATLSNQTQELSSALEAAKTNGEQLADSLRSSSHELQAARMQLEETRASLLAVQEKTNRVTPTRSIGTSPLMTVVVHIATATDSNVIVEAQDVWEERRTKLDLAQHQLSEALAKETDFRQQIAMVQQELENERNSHLESQTSLAVVESSLKTEQQSKQEREAELRKLMETNSILSGELSRAREQLAQSEGITKQEVADLRETLQRSLMDQQVLKQSTCHAADESQARLVLNWECIESTVGLWLMQIGAVHSMLLKDIEAFLESALGSSNEDKEQVLPAAAASSTDSQSVADDFGNPIKNIARMQEELRHAKEAFCTQQEIQDLTLNAMRQELGGLHESFAQQLQDATNQRQQLESRVAELAEQTATISLANDLESTEHAEALARLTLELQCMSDLGNLWGHAVAMTQQTLVREVKALLDVVGGKTDDHDTLKQTIDEERQALESEVSSVVSALLSAKDELRRMKDNLVTKQQMDNAALKTLQQEAAELERAKKASEEEALCLKAAIQVEVTAREMAEEKVSALDSSLQGKQLELENLRAADGKRRTEFEEREAALAQELSDLSTVVAVKIQGLEQENQQLKQELDDLKEVYTDLEKEKSALHEKHQTEQGRGVELGKRVSELEGLIKEVVEDANKRELKLAEVTQVKEALQAELTLASEQNLKLQQSSAELSTACEKMMEELAANERELQVVLDERNRLTKDLDAAQQENASVKQALEERGRQLAAEQDGRKSDRALAERRIDTLSEELNATKALLSRMEFTSMENESASAQRERELSTQILVLKDQLTGLQSALTIESQRLESALEEIHRLKEQEIAQRAAHNEVQSELRNEKDAVSVAKRLAEQLEEKRSETEKRNAALQEKSQRRKLRAQQAAFSITSQHSQTAHLRLCFHAWEDLLKLRKSQRLAIRKRQVGQLLCNQTERGLKLVFLRKWMTFALEGLQRRTRRRCLYGVLATSTLKGRMRLAYLTWLRLTIMRRKLKLKRTAAHLLLSSTIQGRRRAFFAAWRRLVEHRQDSRRKMTAYQLLVGRTQRGQRQMAFSRWCQWSKLKAERTAHRQAALSAAFNLSVRSGHLGRLRIAFGSWARFVKVRRNQKVARLGVWQLAALSEAEEKGRDDIVSLWELLKAAMNGFRQALRGHAATQLEWNTSLEAVEKEITTLWRTAAAKEQELRDHRLNMLQWQQQTIVDDEKIARSMLTIQFHSGLETMRADFYAYQSQYDGTKYKLELQVLANGLKISEKENKLLRQRQMALSELEANSSASKAAREHSESEFLRALASLNEGGTSTRTAPGQSPSTFSVSPTPASKGQGVSGAAATPVLARGRSAVAFALQQGNGGTPMPNTNANTSTALLLSLILARTEGMESFERKLLQSIALESLEAMFALAYRQQALLNMHQSRPQGDGLSTAETYQSPWRRRLFA